MKQLFLFEQQDSSEQTTAKKPRTWFLYVDGASRNNPGKSGAGIHLVADDQTVCKEGFYLGIKTNNQAEYLALLLGLFLLQRYMHPTDVVHIISDSELLVKQMTGLYKIRHPELKPLHALASEITRTVKAHIMHVFRKDNPIADELANEGIDKQNKVPDEFIALLKNYAISL